MRFITVSAVHREDGDYTGHPLSLERVSLAAETQRKEEMSESAVVVSQVVPQNFARISVVGSRGRGPVLGRTTSQL